ncbi:MAG: glycosyltransferase family 4 protein, partial [Phycisphaerales bacterium]|nr:glycosyltransferase family 4 protein [Phycisphaerales bacterium]
MNRSSTSNARGLNDATLPPPTRRGPARVLGISSVILGFRRYAEQLEHWTADRDDIDAVHIRIAMPFAVRAASATWPLPGGWDLHSYRYLLLSDLVIRRWFHGAIDCNRFDVIHWMTQGNAKSMLRLGAHRHLRHAVNIDGTSDLDWKEFGYHRAARRPFRRVERRIFEQCSLIACRNAWAARSVHEDFGIPQQRVMVARSGMPLTMPSKWDAPRETPSDGALPRIAFVGNTWARKGGDRLLRVHQERFADRAELHYFGKGHEEDRSARNVVWHGFIPHDEVVRLLPTMDLAVFPTNEDQLPRAAIECAALGIPLVATRLAAIPEICVDGRTGILIPPGDDAAMAAAIDTMLADPVLRERFGRAARELVESEFDASKTFPALL